MTSPRTGWAYLDSVLGQPGAVLAMAHRGGAYHPEIEGLENTLAAFEHATSLGYDYLETDVHVTADGVLLAFHDEVLDRVTDRVGEIGRLSYAEVREARVGTREEVPAFEALLEKLPQARFNIDIKSDAAVPALVRVIHDHDAADRVLVGSFSGRRLRAFREATGGRVPTSAHPGEALAFVLLPSGRLADLVTRRRVSALQLPRSRAVRLAGRRWRVPVVTAGLVRRAHAAGKHVHVWTIDDPQEMRDLLGIGVDGLITDRTDVLKAVLHEQGSWMSTSSPGGDR